MRAGDLLSMAFRDIAVNRSRAFLTILGIVIGVGAVVMMTGIGRSMEGVILGQISALGPNTIAVWPGNQGPEAGAASLFSDFDSLKVRDVEALQKVESVKNVAPIIFMPGKATYGREKTEPRIVASPPGYYENQTVELTEGRLHDDADESGARPVAVIGSDIAKDLFFGQSAVDKRIDINNRRYTVIGVLEPVGSQFFQNLDDRIIVPFATAKAEMQRTYVDMITLEAGGDIDRALADVQDTLRRRHNVVPALDGSEKNDDFIVRSAAQAQEILGTVSLSLTLFITMIAAISLLVGGIGIMNIMLVAVTERTREIGLRKALGAKRKDILIQFLVEAVALTLFGGIVGLIFGVAVNFLIATVAGGYIEDYVFALSPLGIALALLMAGITGIIFGIYPAKKAAMLDPIVALRYE